MKKEQKFTAYQLANLLKIRDALGKERLSTKNIQSLLGVESDDSVQICIKTLKDVFGYDISFRKGDIQQYELTGKKKGAYLDLDTQTPKDQTRSEFELYRLGEAYQPFFEYLERMNQNKFIQLEPNTQFKGFKLTGSILTAIAQQHAVSFSYQKTTDPVPIARVVMPYMIREHKNRWFLFGLELKRDKEIDPYWLKFYSLDKITDLHIDETDFYKHHDKTNYRNETQNPQYWECVYGLYVQIEDFIYEPTTIELSFKPETGKELKAKPFHTPFELLEDSEQAYRIRLKIYYHQPDLLKDLASYGNQVKVTKPPHLAEALKKYLREALTQY